MGSGECYDYAEKKWVKGAGAWEWKNEQYFHSNGTDTRFIRSGTANQLFGSEKVLKSCKILGIFNAQSDEPTIRVRDYNDNKLKHFEVMLNSDQSKKDDQRTQLEELIKEVKKVNPNWKLTRKDGRPNKIFHYRRRLLPNEKALAEILEACRAAESS